MGKKRIIKKSGSLVDSGLKPRQVSKIPKKKILHGIIYIQATYNNTSMLLTDTVGNAIISSSSGSSGFKGSKKGTPFAAGKVGELLADKAELLGIKDVEVIIKGVGAGRESSVRAFMARGFNVLSIKDKTPIPFNGPKPKKPRRV